MTGPHITHSAGAGAGCGGDGNGLQRAAAVHWRPVAIYVFCDKMMALPFICKWSETTEPAGMQIQFARNLLCSYDGVFVSSLLQFGHETH